MHLGAIFWEKNLNFRGFHKTSKLFQKNENLVLFVLSFLKRGYNFLIWVCNRKKTVRIKYSVLHLGAFSLFSHICFFHFPHNIYLSLHFPTNPPTRPTNIWNTYLSAHSFKVNKWSRNLLSPSPSPKIPFKFTLSVFLFPRWQCYKVVAFVAAFLQRFVLIHCAFYAIK